MYCSTCGVALTPGLSYCNHCGEKLSRARDNGPGSPEVKPELLVSAMAGVFILGLVAITMLIGMMKSVLGANIGQVLAFAMLSFLIMLSLEGVFLRLLFRRRRGPKEAGDTGQLKGQATRELDAAQARVLPEHMSSVTEHTTRAFDPTYPERRSK
ncbi:MAG: hypothetical protein M3R69_17255 [Acidobacteriota bacterium]|nr:hypothetical protein [Acidobacteriota bacterium]